MKKQIKILTIILAVEIILQIIIPIISIANTENSDIKFSYEVDEENKYILGVKIKTTKEEIKEKIISDIEYKIVTKDGQEAQSETQIGTGMRIEFITGETYEIVVRGDLNGDGEVSVTDSAKIKKHLIGKEILSGCYEKAGDISEDGKVNEEDLTKLKRILVGLDSLYTPVPLASKVKVGDYVEYKPSQSSYEIDAKYTGYTSTQTISTDDLKWRVLKVENNQVTLISENVTASTLKLSGIEGYNNAVYILNDMSSKLYSRERISENVRCLNFDDVKPLLSQEFWNTADLNTYQKTITKTESEVYPNISFQDKQVTINGNRGTLDYSEQNELVTGSQSYANTQFVSNYIYSPTESETYYIDPIYYELFNGSFYLSTRTMDTYNGFRLYMMWGNSIAPATLYRWDDSIVDLDYGLHPVVTLKENIETMDGIGTKEAPYVIF